MTLNVSAVATKEDREAFLRLPWRLYKDHPTWVPNLLILQREAISEDKNPFFEHGEARLFLATRDGVPVGRISASIDRDHNAQHDERTGFYGFFESEDDPAVARALFTAAEAWLRERGMVCSRGPLSFNLNQEAGLQVEGFDHPAMIAMPQSLPYYEALTEACGYRKAMDLLAYRWELQEPPDRIRDAIERTRAFPGLTVRNIRMNRLRHEVDILLDIYNETWQDNWGYVRVTRSEAAKLVSDLRLIADKRVVLIAEVDGEPAGMIVSLPNLYEAIRDFDGTIDPVKALKLVWRLKIRGLSNGRIMLFGVKRDFRTRELYGLPFVLLEELYMRSLKATYRWCEQSWILETNSRMIAMMPYWGAHVYKRYRIYEKPL